jgi:formate dehydrogenase maturation protein FdhE
MRIEKKGYVPVECDEPLACPFCGSTPELAQLAHSTTYKNRKPVRCSIVFSTQTLEADTFWFKCNTCGATTGKHCDTAQEASELWNKRNRGD